MLWYKGLRFGQWPILGKDPWSFKWEEAMTSEVLLCALGCGNFLKDCHWLSQNETVNNSRYSKQLLLLDIKKPDRRDWPKLWVWSLLLCGVLSIKTLLTLNGNTKDNWGDNKQGIWSLWALSVEFQRGLVGGLLLYPVVRHAAKSKDVGGVILLTGRLANGANS